MDSSFGSLAKRKQLVGAIVAAGILAAIFIPLQTAEAATVNVNIPSSFNQSTAGQAFSLSFNIAPSEVVGLAGITVFIDKGTANQKTFTFNAAGTRLTGTPASMMSNLVISPPPGTITSNPYAYGLGISTGYVGQTTVTISGTLKTALLVTGTSPSTHTIEADIDSGPSGIFHSNQVSFTVNPVATIGTGSVPGGGGTKTVTVNTPSGNSITIQISNVNTGGNAVVVKKDKDQIKSEIPAIFSTATSTTGTFSLSGATYQTRGELFDIDLSGLGTPGVDFSFPVDVTISYDDSGLTLSQEQQIRFMHWTGTAWEDVTANIANNPNTNSNTITGRLNSLSPVVAAISTGTTSTGGGGSSGGGGGSSSGGRGPVVLLPSIIPPSINVLPESHFALFPLDRFQIASSAFLNAQGFAITQAKVNQQFSISADFANYQQTNQTYAFIVQVVHPQGYVQELRWQEGTLASGQSTDISTSVTLPDEGVYKVQIFILDGLGESPRILSEQTVKNIQVTR